MHTQARKTAAGRGGYLVAVLLASVGLLTFVVAVTPAVREVRSSVEGLQRVVIQPGATREFTARKPGRMLIHYEPISRVGKQVFETETTWEPTLTLTGEHGAVELSPTPSTVVYRVEGRAGHSLFEAQLPAAGPYWLAVSDAGQAGEVGVGIGPATDQPRVLALGEVPVELLKNGFWGVYGGAVALGLLGCAALVVGLVTWARRHGTRTGRSDSRPAAWKVGSASAAG